MFEFDMSRHEANLAALAERAEQAEHAAEVLCAAAQEIPVVEVR